MDGALLLRQVQARYIITSLNLSDHHLADIISSFDYSLLIIIIAGESEVLLVLGTSVFYRGQVVGIVIAIVPHRPLAR